MTRYLCAALSISLLLKSNSIQAETIIPDRTKRVLADMIGLIPPGKTIYSRTTLENCNEGCQKTPVCELPSVLCAAPTFSQELGVFTRTEFYEEGLQRYLIIAQAISETVQEMSWNSGSEQCQKQCTRSINSLYKSDLNTQCKECLQNHPWLGSTRELEAALTTVMFGESGFRGDVHSGIGALSKGDCEWRDNISHKKVKPFSKNASPVDGSCRSVCLAQINIGNDEKWGLKAADLVGTDLASTKRCASVSTRVLAASRRLCSGPLSDFKGDWAKGMFTAYGTGGKCKVLTGTAATLHEADWPLKRSGWFWNLMKHPGALDERAKMALGLSSSAETK